MLITIENSLWSSLSFWLHGVERPEMFRVKWNFSLAFIVQELMKEKAEEAKVNEIIKCYLQPKNCDSLAETRVNLPIGNNPSYQARTSDVKQQKVQKSTVFCHIHKVQLNRTTLTFFPRSRVRQWFAWVTGKQYVPNAKFPIPKATFFESAINVNPCPATRNS